MSHAPANLQFGRYQQTNSTPTILPYSNTKHPPPACLQAFENKGFVILPEIRNLFAGFEAGKRKQPAVNKRVITEKVLTIKKLKIEISEIRMKKGKHIN